MKLCFESVFSDNNLNSAMETLLAKKNVCGSDGIYVNEFQEYWKLNGEKILKTIREKTYEPSVLQEKEIVMSNGKRRKIVIYTCTDRLILRALCNIMQDVAEPMLSKYCYAYRKENGIVNAVEKAVEYIRTGKTWVAEIDVSNFFDQIDLDKMWILLTKIVDDDSILYLVRKYLYCKVERDYIICNISRGLIQGSSISPVMSNLYLNQLDQWLESEGISFCRYGDNINIYAEKREQARLWYEKVINILEEQYLLPINVQKSGVFPALNREYLGYKFCQEKSSNQIVVKRKKKEEKTRYRYWHSSALQLIDKEYHIVSDGILTKKDYTILFENNEGKKYLPVETMGNLNIYSDVIFSSGFFEFINQYNLKISLYNRYGKFIGAFYSGKHSLAANHLLNQAVIYNDNTQRLVLAKSICVAAAHNMRANLRYYRKKEKITQRDISVFSEYITEMNQANSIGSLMLIEARCRQKYYACMGKIIDTQGFHFKGRNKRPPKDPVNALISFGNVFLYERIATEITKASLDVRIGVLHATNKRNASLNLDIAEIFKPIIVDRTIFTLIHKRCIDVDTHFEKHGEYGIYLNTEGKRVFIKALQRKLYSKIKIDNREVTYDILMRNEIQKLKRRINCGEKYRPYKYY